MLSITELAAAVRAYALSEGISENHRVLQGRLARRIGNLAADGRLQTTRHNGRYLIEPSRVPEAAALLGLTAQPRRFAA